MTRDVRSEAVVGIVMMLTGGLVTSTLLTLLVLPAVYGWLAGRGSAR